MFMSSQAICMFTLGQTLGMLISGQGWVCLYQARLWVCLYQTRLFVCLYQARLSVCVYHAKLCRRSSPQTECMFMFQLGQATCEVRPGCVYVRRLLGQAECMFVSGPVL